MGDARERVIGIDVHRTFGEVVTWRTASSDMPAGLTAGTALEGLGKSLRSTDEVVIEATGNGMAVSRMLTAFVARVISPPLVRGAKPVAV